MAQATRRPLPSIPAVALFTVAAGGATYAVYALAHWAFGTRELGVLLFLGGLTTLLLSWQERAMAHDPRGFMLRFMTGLVIKLIAGLFAIAAILFLLPRGQGVRLALTFAVLYLAYLAFSTMRLTLRSRNLPRA
ncbi:MAG: hypothetical protein KBH07_00235 [Flavobacteriales bacterium]|nr:hypothetical protein [Flavobacteriales bacterium]MBP9079065.1 hypothetical protein [Flavobacteriales bacterium]